MGGLALYRYSSVVSLLQLANTKSACTAHQFDRDNRLPHQVRTRQLHRRKGVSHSCAASACGFARLDAIHRKHDHGAVVWLDALFACYSRGNVQHGPLVHPILGEQDWDHPQTGFPSPSRPSRLKTRLEDCWKAVFPLLRITG